MEVIQQSLFPFPIMLWQELTSFTKLFRIRAVLLILVLIVVIGGGFLLLWRNLQPPSVSTVAPVPTPRFVPGKVSVLTAHYDNARTGQNRQETILNTTNVNPKQFGLRDSYQVTGDIQAQPLYVSNVSIGGHRYNVVYVATTADHVYAFNADSDANDDPLWSVDLGLKGGLGIFGTPVISETNGSGTIYLIANDSESEQHVYALDIATGQQRTGSPSLIQVPDPKFNPETSHERSSLVLVNGVVYAGWSASEFTKDVQHGWVLGFDTTTLKLVSAFDTTATNTSPPNPGSVWQSITGIAADNDGNLYPIVGNGPFDINTGGSDYGDSFVKLSTSGNKLTPVDYFTPFNQKCLFEKDYDLGSGGNLLIPDQTGTAHPHLMLSASKDGRLYLVDRDNLGKFTADPALTTCGSDEEKRTDVDQIVQESSSAFIPGLFMAPTYWLGPDGQQFIYLAGANADSGQGDHLKAFQLSNGKLNLTPQSQTDDMYGYPGANVVVSSNGSQPGTGIVWSLEITGCVKAGCGNQGPAVLHAYDAMNLGAELYSSKRNIERDGMDSSMRFTAPVVADGKVFACSRSTLYIYGLLDQQ